MYHFFKQLILLSLVLFGSISINAYDFVENGIYYEKNSDEMTVGVTFKNSDYNCYSGNIVIPSSVRGYRVTSINLFAFRDCSNTINITLPNSLELIDWFAFQNCSGLSNINIPNSVKKIHAGAFLDCHSLASIIIPNSVDTIGSGAFAACTSLTSIDLPNSIDFLAWELFYNCTGLQNITIPSSVKDIGAEAFKGCSNLTSVIIPNSVKSIYKSAFSGCINLENITCYAITPPTVDTNTFDNYDSRLAVPCQSLITYKNTNIWNFFNKIVPIDPDSSLYFENNGIYYYVTDINEKIVEVYSADVDIINSSGDIVIPPTVIHNGITYTVTSIGAYSFKGCSNLSSIVIPNTVTSIGSSAFRNCTGLTSITIPNSVTSIGNYAFCGCSALTSISIPNSVTSISENLFSGCSGLISITIPNSVTTINSSAFEGCSQLTTVILPNTLQILKSKAFNNCNALNTVYSYATTPPVMESSDCFSSYNTTTLYVKYPSLNSYKNTDFWNNFYQIYGIDADGNILVDGISLNASNKNLNVNQTFKLTATITPDCAPNKAIIWSSSNPAVATVDNDGLVAALAAGTATITATTTDGSNLSAACNVTVSIIPATSISLNKTSLKLDPDDTYQLVATILPNNASYKTVSWTSSNTSVATVDENGLVRPVSTGTVTIKATTTDGTNLSASCQVTVIREVKSITLNASNLSLILPETAQLTATITPSDATYPTLNWTSSNNSVATVDGNGLITSKGVGTTTIKATTTDGTNLSASCQVTVSKQYVTSITLNETNLVMHIGETVQLIADVQPENASNPTVNWSSGNTSVARVDNNGLVTAVAGGTTYIRASAADGSNRYATCAIEVLYDYYLKLDTLSHIRGTAAQVVDLPVTLVNKNPISGIQFDVSLPDGVTFNLVDGLPDVWLDDARGTRSHSISASQLSNGKYRVLVTSSTSKNLKGNDGVLVHMNMLLPQLHNTGNSYINISNIIASEADETRHTLNNTSSKVSMYYIVGDADANASVDIADHAATASKILGKSPSPFYYDAANVDANYSLDVVDLVGITNIALEIKPITIRQVPRSGHLENRLYCDKLRLNESGEAIITLGADCDFDFAGFQMDVSLPPGLTLVEATLNDEASKLGLATETLPESGVTRLLATSFSDVDVSGACPKLLTLKVKAERDYISSGSVNIGFDNIIFAERNLTSHYFDAGSIEYIEPSGVHEFMDKARIYVKDGNIVVDTPVAGMVQIVATDGRMVEHTAHIGHNVYAFEGSGIYIVNFNGKTIKVKL